MMGLLMSTVDSTAWATTPSVRLTDYFYPPQIGATWVYQGPKAGVGSPDRTTHTRIRMANTDYALTLYNPNAYIQSVLLIDNDYGYFTGSTFVSTENWQEYYSVADGFALYGDDDGAESVRVPMTPFPVTMAIGESATWQGSFYDGSGNVFADGSLTLQIIEQTAATVPAGTFSDCIHLRVTITAGALTQVQEEWWALGVGRIRMTRISGYEPEQNDGGYLQELESYATAAPTLAPSLTSTPTAVPSATPTLTIAPAVTPTPTPRVACSGDCDGSGDVTVNEIITLVNIALGTAEQTACAHGIPSAAAVDITLIVQAVNSALTNCPAAASIQLISN